MRLHRFYINTPIEETKFVVNDEHLIHQWRNVFRYNTGTLVTLFDNSGFEYEAIIYSLSNREAEVEILKKKEGIMLKTHITLFQSIIKKDNMEWVAEKATELGVSKIVPIVSERSEKKDLNFDRIRKIIIEASEQSGRATLPEVGEVMSFEEAIKGAGEGAVFFDTAPPPSPLPEGKGGAGQEISIFIGPEGGWSQKEIEYAKECGAHFASLGPLTLRAETAAIVAIALISLGNS